MSPGDATAKEKIFNTAVKLFARKGYTGVGLREISKEAGVNISMTSYYYNGKAGILREIFERFYELFHKVVEDSLNSERSIEDNIKEYVRNSVRFYINEPDLVKVVYRELPIDMPELSELKVEKMKRLQGVARKFVLGEGTSSVTPYFYLVFPALTNMLLSSFQLHPVFRKIYNIPYDENFIENYSETLSSLFLYGFMNFHNNLSDSVSDESPEG